ncbi:MAG: enoyl-CoA hydratase [Chloroflexi bacterium]|nr:enoyl-CoA hydratase [Chloroflexota bacterium]|tara:strand:- start:945 stop:1748 length:804 start_codon:yes stop_codon:yes gene_type:complete
MKDLLLNTDRMIVKSENGVGWMIFNQPKKRNAVSFDMWKSIPKIIDYFNSNSEVRVIVISGAGNKSFVSGADISEFEDKRNTKKQVEIYDQATNAANISLLTSEKPLIAMIKGYCIGGGLAIALSADIRIASNDSLFAVPAAKLGVGYRYAGVKQLMELVGPSYTKEIFFTGRKFNSEEALRMGLVNSVIGIKKIDSYIHKITDNIVNNAPLTIRSIKSAVNEGIKDPDDRDIMKVNKMVQECFESKDYVEGRRAFMEKRLPKFQGN